MWYTFLVIMIIRTHCIFYILLSEICIQTEYTHGDILGHMINEDSKTNIIKLEFTFAVCLIWYYDGSSAYFWIVKGSAQYFVIYSTQHPLSQFCLMPSRSSQTWLYEQKGQFCVFFYTGLTAISSIHTLFDSVTSIKRRPFLILPSPQEWWG